MGTYRLPPLTKDDYMKPESILSSPEVADTASSSSNYGTEFLVIVGIFLLIMLIATIQKSYQDRLKEGHSPTQATAHTASSLMHLLISIAIPAGLVFLFFPSLHNASDVWQLLFGGFCCLLLFGGIVSDIFTDVKNRVRPTPRSNHTTPQPASADYLTAPITAQSAPTRGAMQGVHPIGKVLFTLIGGGILLAVSYGVTLGLFYAFDHVPVRSELLLLFASVFLALFALMSRIFSSSEKKIQTKLSRRPQESAHRSAPQAAPRAMSTLPHAAPSAAYKPTPSAPVTPPAVRKPAPYTPVTPLAVRKPAPADPSAIYRSDPLVKFVAQLESVPPTAPQTVVEPSSSPAPQTTADTMPTEQDAPDIPLRPQHTSRTHRPPRRDKHR